jgi:hypothetical protein
MGRRRGATSSIRRGRAQLARAAEYPNVRQNFTTKPRRHQERRGKLKGPGVIETTPVPFDSIPSTDAERERLGRGPWASINSISGRPQLFRSRMFFVADQAAVGVLFLIELLLF